VITACQLSLRRHHQYTYARGPFCAALACRRACRRTALTRCHCYSPFRGPQTHAAFCLVWNRLTAASYPPPPSRRLRTALTAFPTAHHLPLPALHLCRRARCRATGHFFTHTHHSLTFPHAPYTAACTAGWDFKHTTAAHCLQALSHASLHTHWYPPTSAAMVPFCCTPSFFSSTPSHLPPYVPPGLSFLPSLLI